MDFTTIKYLLFLATVTLVYRASPRRLRPALLAVASYGFYILWSGAMALLLLAATGTAYFVARLIESAQSERAKAAISAFGVAALTGLLVYFKTQPFWTTNVPIPIGLSYYTFKLISYVVDVSRTDIPAEKDFILFAAYASFFPQILAGPIQRSRGFFNQVRQAPNASLPQTVLGVQRILLGFFKKFVVANNLELLVNFTYGHLYQSGTPLILGFWLYPLHLYADFSGLTDIANGSALLLGIEAPRNFQAPFAAATIGEYWRRWHVTLTSWLTDYVSNPLTVATRNFGAAGLVFSLTVNMVLIGIWHRVIWAFALFGLMHAFYLSTDALTRKRRQRFYKTHARTNRIMTILAPVLTFQLVAAGLVFFRGATLPDSVYYLGHLAKGMGGLSQEFLAFVNESGRSVLLGCGAYALMEWADYWRRHEKQSGGLQSLPQWGRWSVYSCTAATVVFVILLLLSTGKSRNPFVYAIF